MTMTRTLQKFVKAVKEVRASTPVGRVAIDFFRLKNGEVVALVKGHRHTALYDFSTSLKGKSLKDAASKALAVALPSLQEEE